MPRKRLATGPGRHRGGRCIPQEGDDPMVLEIGHDTASLTPNALSHLVRTLGKADFDDTLLHTAVRMLGAELVSAFTLDAEGQPHCCLARAVAGLGNELAEHAAQRYVAGYWHSDPGLAQLRQA